MERTIANGSFAAFMLQFFQLFEPLRWLIFLAFILILADLRWGIAEAKLRKEEIRFSRALRRTVNKFIDYVLWIIIAALLGQGFGTIFYIPTLSFIVLLVVYVIEMSSVCNHYFRIKGVKLKVNLFRLFKKNGLFEKI